MSEREVIYSYNLPEQYRDSQKFWARPTKSESGAAYQQLIYIAVGHALSNWEHIETAMAMMFSILIDSRSTAASRAYGSIFGSRGKADALEQAGAVFFAIRSTLADQRDRESISEIKKAETDFDSILSNYRSASSRRNDAAHGFVYDLSPSIEGETRTWFLIPPMYQSSHRGEIWTADDVKLRERKGLRMGDPKARSAFMKMVRKNANYVYSVQEIKTFAQKFAYFYGDILRFLREFRPEGVGTDEQIDAVVKGLAGV